MQRNDTNYGLLSYYAGGKPIATVYRTCEVAPTLGVKDIEDANGTNAAYSANPTNLAHFCRYGCSAQSEHGSRHQPQRRNPLLGQVLLPERRRGFLRLYYS